MAWRWATCCTESLSALTLPCILLTMDRSLSIDVGVFGSVLASFEVTMVVWAHSPEDVLLYLVFLIRERQGQHTAHSPTPPTR